MFYTFKTKEGTIEAWLTDAVSTEKEATGIVGYAEIQKYKDGNPKKYRQPIRRDESGKLFFTWNRERVYTDDFMALMPSELVEKIKAKDRNVFGDTLCQTLLKYGIDSLHVVINTDTVPVEYKFQEEYLRRPKDYYRLKLVPANEEEYDIYPKKDYYVYDLVGLLKDDVLKLMANT